MSEMRDIATNAATLLSNGGVVSYSPTAAYTGQEAQPPLSFKDVPANPDRVVVLTPVVMKTDPADDTGVVMLQVRTRGARGNALDADDIADSIKPLLHGLKGVQWGSVFVVQCWRKSSVPLGEDDSLRWERVDHYYLDVNFAATANNPARGWD